MQLFRFFSVWLSLACLSFAPTAAAQAVDGGHARVELVSERAIAIAGETIWMGLSFEIDPDWHIYWQNAGDAGLPPTILWAETSPLAAAASGPFEWPVPELLPIVPGEIMDYGYSDQVLLPFPVTIPANADGPILFEGIADYLICEDICIPESAPIRLLLSVGTGQLPDERGAAMITAALERVPVKFEGEASVSKQGTGWILSLTGSQVSGLSGATRFFPKGHEIIHAADQPVSFGPDGLQISLVPSEANASPPDRLSGVVRVGDIAVSVDAQPGAALDGTSGRTSINLPVLMVLALIGGLILNLMPCVLPVLSIKAMGVVSAAASGQAREVRAHGIWYTIGVLLSFAALAAAIIAVRAATGMATWGFWMQSPLVITILVLVIFVIGLWLLGLFELGGSVQNVGEGLARKQGSVGAFFTGVLAVVVGAPCTGPFLGVALGGVMTQPAPFVFAVLMAMGLGLALPFLLLSFVPRLQALMPKPGAWMGTLKQVFAFPMFLTAAYFLWTLGDLSGTFTVAIAVAGAASIAFGLWVLKQSSASGRVILLCLFGLAAIIPAFGLMSARTATEYGIGFVWLAGIIGLFVLAAKLPSKPLGFATRALAVAAIVIGVTAPVMQARTGMPTASGSVGYSPDYPTEAWSPQRVAELTAEGRAVFVDFTATWCVNCQANKRTVLTTRTVSEAFVSANVAFLVADYTRPDPVISAELQKHNRAGVPMYLWYAPGETEPQVLPEILSVALVTGLIEGK